MKKSIENYEDFSVEELESRFEMKKWIRIEIGPCGCDDYPGTEV
jgi:hypothetical protein